MDADSHASSAKENSSDDAVVSSSVKEQTAARSERRPPSSQHALSKSQPDDVMVQIKAGKSEVRSLSADLSAVQAVTFLEPSLVSVKQMNNHD